MAKRTTTKATSRHEGFESIATAVAELAMIQRQRTSLELSNRYNQADFQAARRVLNELANEVPLPKKLNHVQREAWDLVLGYYEDVAIAIRLHAADEMLLYSSLVRVVQMDWLSSREYVNERRDELKRRNRSLADTFCAEFQELARRWSDMVSYWNRKPLPPLPGQHPDDAGDK